MQRLQSIKNEIERVNLEIQARAAAAALPGAASLTALASLRQR